MEINLELHFEAIRELIASNHRLERIMSKLADDSTALTAAVEANTIATQAEAANQADVASAEAAIEAATAQVEANTETLSPAAPVTPTV